MIARLKFQIKENRHRLEASLQAAKERRLFSPAYYSQYQVTVPLMQQYARGRLIDLGCGSMPYKEFVGKQVEVYHGLDVESTSSDITYIGDVQTMPMIASESYDVAVCLEVLEHVPEPARALSEIFRLLRPRGVLILSLPHLSRLHNEPHDYYRFTKYGIHHSLRTAGFQIIHIYPRGGLFSFLGHQLATLGLGLVWGIPVLWSFAWWMNSWLVTRGSYYLDQWLDRDGLYAMAYTAVAIKP